MKCPYFPTLCLYFFFAIAQTPAQAQPGASTERSLAIDLEGLRLSLRNAPLEKSRGLADKIFSIALPMPEGGDRQFNVQRNTLMAPEFAARFPEFRTYDLSAVDDARGTGHMTLTPDGLLATIFTSQGLIEIRPEDMLNPVLHKVLIDNDRLAGFRCGFEGSVDGLQSPRAKSNLAANGSMTRTYDLAIVTTGEYGQTHGGTVGTATAVVTQLIGALEDIYERELAVKFNLLTPRIYLDPNNDPFPSGNTDRTLMAAEAVAMNWPDPADYDLGHVLHSEGGNADWGGGVAAYGACSAVILTTTDRCKIRIT